MFKNTWQFAYSPQHVLSSLRHVTGRPIRSSPGSDSPRMCHLHTGTPTLLGKI